MSEVVVIETARGRDGKRYPAVMPPPAAWRWEVLTLTHQLAHVQELSERETRRQLLARGYRRSAGSVHYDLTRVMPTCPVCSGAGDG